MRVLVTGASGFVGRELLRAFEATHHQVVAGVRDEADGAQLAGAPERVVFDVEDESQDSRSSRAGPGPCQTRSFIAPPTGP